MSPLLLGIGEADCCRLLLSGLSTESKLLLILFNKPFGFISWLVLMFGPPPLFFSKGEELTPCILKALSTRLSAMVKVLFVC